MRALRIGSIFLTLVIGAAAAAGCSSNSDNKPTAAATIASPVATDTPTPAPTATPTVDPKAALADQAYKDIVLMRARAAEVAYKLDPIARLYTGTTVRSATPDEAAAFLKVWQEVLGTCKDVPVLQPSVDLWPGPYEKLGNSLWSTCQVILDRAKASAPAATDEWTAVAVSVTRALNTASAQLPDYSEAQLKRAIADRP